MNNVQFLIHVMSYDSPQDARIWPCLVGPTGSGKTSICRQLAEDLHLPMYRLLLGTMLPEDVLGLPRIIDGMTQWSIPKWAHELQNKPGILFLDELDKSRTETLSAVLTLCSELRVQDIVLHPQTKIIAAMQPIDIDLWLSDETTKALSARFAFLTNPYDWEYLGKKLQIDLSGITSTSTHLPLLPTPAPRQVEWWTGLYRFFRTQKIPDTSVKDLITTAGMGLFSENNLKTFIERLDKFGLSKESLVSLLKDGEEASTLIRQLSIPELIELSGSIFVECHSHNISEVFAKIWTTGNQEDAEKFMAELHRQLIEKSENAPDNAIEVAGGDSEEQFAVELSKMVTDISEIWNKRKIPTQEEGAKTPALKAPSICP